MSRMSQIQGTRFSPPLHGIRGLAVLYVVLSHMGNSGLFILPIPHNAIGKVGVWIFFVLSAYLLTSKLYVDLQSDTCLAHTLIRYFIQRVFRIYPLFLFVLGLYVLAGTLTYIDVIEHVTLVQGYAELWAIAVEFKFYFVIPVIAMAANFFRFGIVLWILVVGVVASLISGIVFPPDVFSNSLDLLPKMTPFLIGSMAALLMAHDIPTAWQLHSRFSLVQFVPILALAMSTFLFRHVSAGWTPTTTSPLSPWVGVFMGMSVASLIYACLRWRLLHAIFGSRILVFFGEISFSLYLLHMFVIRFISEHQIPVRTSLKSWIVLLLAVGLATITYWLIERPGIQVGKRLSQRLQIPARSTGREKNTRQPKPAGEVP